MLALDARVTGETRTLAIEAALEGGSRQPSGVALKPPWAARPILAPDPGEGAALLAAVMEPGLRLAVPEANAAAVEAMLGSAASSVRVSCGCGVARLSRGGPRSCGACSVCSSAR